MKYKNLLLLAITGILAIGVSGCSCASKEETYDMLQQSTEIEFEYAVPDYATDTETEAVQMLPWLQLSSLETHQELRAAFEEYVGIIGTTGNKEGIMYYNPVTQEADQNVTLYMATKNSDFRGNFLFDVPMLKFGEIAAENYIDIDVDDINAPYATINAYFELLPDQTEGQFDGDSSISRAQAMALVMRATTPVNESQVPETDADFTAAVGESIYTDFAAPMNQYSYLNTENGLTDKTFNTAMSRGEYICLLTNFIHADYIKDIEAHGYQDLYADTSDVTISTVSDAGNITFAEAIADATNGVPSDMYETFKVAIKNAYLTEDTFEDWDSAITKADAISLFISMSLNYTNESGSSLVNSYSVPSTSSDKPDESSEIMNSEWADINGKWDAVHQWTLYARSQGADSTSGWCWEYLNGSGAGDQPSYAVYMKEGDPLYGTVYHVGDYLPDGDQFCGTGEEFKAMLGQGIVEEAEKYGETSFVDPETGRTIIGTPEEIEAYKASQGYN